MASICMRVADLRMRTPTHTHMHICIFSGNVGHPHRHSSSCLGLEWSDGDVWVRTDGPAEDGNQNQTLMIKTCGGEASGGGWGAGGGVKNRETPF